MSLWSEDECIHFENGLSLFGKDFHQIQLHKVSYRSVCCFVNNMLHIERAANVI